MTTRRDTGRSDRRARKHRGASTGGITNERRQMRQRGARVGHPAATENARTLRLTQGGFGMYDSRAATSRKPVFFLSLLESTGPHNQRRNSRFCSRQAGKENQKKYRADARKTKTPAQRKKNTLKKHRNTPQKHNKNTKKDGGGNPAFFSQVFSRLRAKSILPRQKKKIMPHSTPRGAELKKSRFAHSGERRPSSSPHGVGAGGMFLVGGGC